MALTSYCNTSRPCDPSGSLQLSRLLSCLEAYHLSNFDNPTNHIIIFLKVRKPSPSKIHLAAMDTSSLINTASTMMEDDPTSPEPNHEVMRAILVAVTVVGYLLFGIISIMCITTAGHGGMWIPEWYLDSEGKRGDRAALVGWWTTVALCWPMIWPTILIRKLATSVRKFLGKKRGKQLEREDDGGEKGVWREEQNKR